MITRLEKMPKEQMGITGLKVVARKETAVVLEVTNMALLALRKLYASLSAILFLSTLMWAVCFH